jgi:PTH1 family peptidyl-tRNA hydrolase
MGLDNVKKRLVEKYYKKFVRKGALLTPEQKAELMQINQREAELELAFGFVSLKWSGGLGGHNGLRSTKSVLNTADFWRLRFGIGRPENPNISIADYVLSRFTQDEQELAQNIFSQTNLLLVKLLLSNKPLVLMGEWGKKKICPE